MLVGGQPDSQLLRQNKHAAVDLHSHLLTPVLLRWRAAGQLQRRRHLGRLPSYGRATAVSHGAGRCWDDRVEAQLGREGQLAERARTSGADRAAVSLLRQVEQVVELLHGPSTPRRKNGQQRGLSSGLMRVCVVCVGGSVGVWVWV